MINLVRSFPKVCQRCSNPFMAFAPQSRFCNQCRKGHNTQEARLKGRCPQCGNACTSGAKRCAKCRAERGRLNRICPRCGITKAASSAGQGMRPGMLCHKCSVADRKERKVNWKGGRFKEKTGYIMVYAPNHPRIIKANNRGITRRRQHLAEHILIWERASGRFVPDTWVVHHLNGVRDDNRLENLIAIPKKDHSSWTFVKAMQKRIRDLEQLHLQI